MSRIERANVIAGALIAPDSAAPQAGGGTLGPWLFGGLPINGTRGTFWGQAAPGALLIRTDTPILYINTGSLLSPTWTEVGMQV